MKLKLRKHNYKGKLIVFEGTDGAGKSTLIQMTQEYFTEKVGQKNVLVIKQPTDLSRKTKLFQKMMYSKNHNDIDYRAVQLLTMSDRIQQIKEVIEPALRNGEIVISDRYIYTSLANMLARGYKNEKWFFEVAKHIIMPDISFLVNVDPKLAIKRIKSRPEEKERYLDETHLIKTSKEFLKIQEASFCVLDSSQKADNAFKDIEKSLRSMIL